MVSRVSNGKFEIYMGEEAGWKEIPFIQGFNMGVTIPGYAPGELMELSKGDYIRWFKYVYSMGVNVVR